MVSLQEIARDNKEKGRYWIAFTGDSITSCEWVHPNWREIVEYVLQGALTNYLIGDWKASEWGIRGFNFALDGATTKDILNYVPKMKLIDPDLVIALMGGNDPTFKINPDESVKNIAQIVRALNTKVVWCSSTPAGKGSNKNDEYRPYSDAFNAMDEVKNLQKIDMFNIYQKFDTSRFFTFVSEENPIERIKAGEVDLQHPNQLGNAYISKVVLKEVFSIEFDSEKYWKDTLAGEKYPKY